MGWSGGGLLVSRSTLGGESLDSQMVRTEMSIFEIQLSIPSPDLGQALILERTFSCVDLCDFFIVSKYRYIVD